MERFVQLLLGGGVALVGGLWLLALFEAPSSRWLLGAGLTALGVVGLLVGIGTEIEV
jgi:hypothetical protein